MGVKADVLMPTVATMCIAAVIAVASGCFSITRYEANVRPEKVKPNALLTRKYRLDRVLINRDDCSRYARITEKEFVDSSWMLLAMKKKEDFKSAFMRATSQDLELLEELYDMRSFMDFSRKLATEQPFLRRRILKVARDYQEAYESGDSTDTAECITNMVAVYCVTRGMSTLGAIYKTFFQSNTNSLITGCLNARELQEREFKKDYRRALRTGKSAECAKMYFEAVRESLLRNYPDVFTTGKEAIPLTVLVSWENKFEDPHSYGGILQGLGFPSIQDVEVTYRIRVVPNATDRGVEDLWDEYAESLLEFPPSAQNGGAVRQRETWTSMTIPISFIGMSGDSDWPKVRRSFTRRGIRKKDEEIDSMYSPAQDYMSKYVFDSVCDGDIIAALVMRSINKMVECE